MSAGELFKVPPGEKLSVVLPPVTTTQLVMYAGASGDYNRIHYDQAFAVEAGLGGVVAHGMLTMGLMARALQAWSGPGNPVASMSVRFTAPVRPGDAVEVSATVRPGKGGGSRHCELIASVAGKTVAAGQAVVARGIQELRNVAAYDQAGEQQ